MDIVVQKAKLTDLDLLVKWRMEVLQEVFAVPAAGQLTRLELENREYYQNALPNEQHIACFAWVDNEIAGCGGECLYQEMPSPDNPVGACAYLMNIYTRPEFRGQGVGRETVNWLVKQAKDRGITKIYLEASECGRPLYRKIGFCDMRGYMKLKEQGPAAAQDSVPGR